MTTPRTSRWVLWIALVPALLHLIPNAAYGYFGDEFYYLACARRPAAGYVDHPPLSVWLLDAWTRVAGDSVFALRVPPALASAGLVVLSTRMAARLGGSAAAQAMTAWTAALAPAYLGIFDFYSMNAFEVVLWTAIAALVLARQQGASPRVWLGLGVLFGLGALNKHTIVLPTAGLAVGFLLTPMRSELRTRWPWIGAVVAIALFAPNLVWQLQNDWPSLEFYSNAHTGKNLDQSFVGVLIGQALALGPVGAPLALLGLASLAIRPAQPEQRVFFWCYLVLLASMVSSASSRPDRIAGGYPILIAAGAVRAEGLFGLAKARWRTLVATGTCCLGGLALLPIAVAAVPKPLALVYANAMGDLLAVEKGKQAELPLWLNYRQGWEELAKKVAAAADTLTPAERERALIYAASYGYAGSMEHFGPDLDLPAVICPHNSYYHWSEGQGDRDVYLTIGLGRAELDILFEDVQVATEVERSTHTLPIYVARNPKMSFNEVWDQLRVYR